MARINGVTYRLTDTYLPGVAHKHVVTDDTSLYIVKYGDDAECMAEVIMSRVFKACGIAVQHVDTVKDDTLSLCPECDPDESPVMITMADDVTRGWGNMSAEDVLTVQLVDYLVCNADRHEGNIMHRDDRAFVIDNGYAFRASGASYDVWYLNHPAIRTLSPSRILHIARYTIAAVVEVMDGVDPERRDLVMSRLTTIVDSMERRLYRDMGGRTWARFSRAMSRITTSPRM